MPCGHTLCLWCVTGLQPQNQQTLECPFCKKKHWVQIGALPINYQLIAVVEQFKQSADEPGPASKEDHPGAKQAQELSVYAPDAVVQGIPEHTSQAQKAIYSDYEVYRGEAAKQAMVGKLV